MIVLRDLQDPGIRSGAIPQSAWRLHRNLTPKFGRWAEERVGSLRGTQLATQDISGTEWPLFGAVFYLWATESLQDAWDKDPHQAPVAPGIYAKATIEAVARLVVDPKQAGWVQKHWGPDYLKKENLFYRMLCISGLTSHARLSAETRYLPMLREQVESLSAELEASPHGLLNDYPGECYPGDVMTAIAAINRADKVLGTDHSAFVARSLRAFQGEAAEESTGLVPYLATARDGKSVGGSRGCGNSYISVAAPELWPEQARIWYARYAKDFWQEVWTGAGFREFPAGDPNEWYMDVDSGPVIKGYGFSACAFGTGAARANGHMEHAFPLTAEMYAASWPLPNGVFFIPRLLSNATDAPYLGETGVLYNLTRQPVAGVPVKLGGAIPGFTRIVILLQIVIGLGLLAGVALSLRKWWRDRAFSVTPFSGTQFALWLCLLLGFGILLALDRSSYAMAVLLAAQLLPRGIRNSPKVPN